VIVAPGDGSPEGRETDARPVRAPEAVRLAPRTYAAESAVSAMRAAVGAVPWVGPALTEALFDFRSRIKQRRFEAFMSDVADEVSRLSEESLDRAYLESEQFSDFFEALVLRVLRTRERDRTARLRDLFVKQLQRPTSDAFQEAFLDLAATLHEDQIRILRAHREFGSIRTKKEWRERFGEGSPTDDENEPYGAPFRTGPYYGIEAPAYRFLVQDLIARGLMFDNSTGYWNSRALDVVDVTEYGRAFLDFVGDRSNA
jgi:hypothetical protein